MKPMRKSVLLISGLLAFSLSLNHALRADAQAQEAAMDTGENSPQAKRNIIAEHVNRGNRLMSAKQFQGALSEYDAAKKLDPNNPIVRQNIAECRNNMGIQLFRSRHFADAIVQFEKCLKVNPNHAQARRNISLCQQTMDQLGVYDAPSGDDEDETENKPEKTAKTEQKPEDTSPKVVGGSESAMTVSSGGTAMFASGNSLYPSYSTQGTASSKKTEPTIPITKPTKPVAKAGASNSVGTGTATLDAAGAGTNAAAAGTGTSTGSAIGGAGSASSGNNSDNSQALGPNGVSAGSAFEPVIPGTVPTIAQPPDSTAATPSAMHGSSPNQAALAAGYAPAAVDTTTTPAASNATKPAPSQADAFLNALAKEQGAPASTQPGLVASSQAGSPSQPVSQTLVTPSVSSAAQASPSALASSQAFPEAASLEDKVASLEIKVYGKKNDQLPILKRIEQLEVDYIGQARQGTLNERVENLRKQILHN